jgi:hypothetical protein
MVFTRSLLHIGNLTIISRQGGSRFVYSMKRSVIAAGVGLAFVVVGAGVGNAAVVGPTPGAVVSQCNGDPGFDPSNDPIHCHSQHHHHWHF